MLMVLVHALIIDSLSLLLISHLIVLILAKLDSILTFILKNVNLVELNAEDAPEKNV